MSDQNELPDWDGLDRPVWLMAAGIWSFVATVFGLLVVELVRLFK